MAPPSALLALAVFCLAIAAVRAVAPNGNCNLLYNGTEITDNSWRAYYNASNAVGSFLMDDATSGTVYQTLTTVEVTGLSPVNVSEYIDVQFDITASTLSLVVTEAFKEYEDDMITASNPSQISTIVRLTCSDGKTNTLKIIVDVEDLNNHPPVFTESSYMYELPMPFPSGIELSCIVGVINVMDIDFSNSKITIEFDDQGDQVFTATTSYVGDRNYAVYVSSKTPIELKETTDFTLTALDNGSPQQRSEPVTMTITANQEASPPTVPRFALPVIHKTISTQDIVAGKEIASVTISEGYSDDVDVYVTTEDDEGLTPPIGAFEWETTAGTDGAASVSLRWAKDVDSAAVEDFKYALIVVEAKRDRGLSASQSGTTVVHLSLPGMDNAPTTGSPTGSTQCPECPTTCEPTSTTTGCPTDCSEFPDYQTTCSPCETTTTTAGCPNDCSECPATECPSTSPSTGSETGSSACPDCPSTCTPCDPCPTTEPTPSTTGLPPGPPISFTQERYSAIVSSGYSGLLLDLPLNEYDSEGYPLKCRLDATDYVASLVTVVAVDEVTCQLTADVFLDPGSYSFNVVASLEGTSSTATAGVALGVSATIMCNSSRPTIFSNALLVVSTPENQKEPQSILPAGQLTDDMHCTFQVTVDPDNYRDWVQVDETTGAVNVTDLDYEKVTSLVITLRCNPKELLRRSSRALYTKDQPNWPRSLLYDDYAMSVLLLIADVNDNPPAFTDGDRLVVAYPTGDLLKRVQPGPVATLTATDEDEGQNAQLHYSLDEAGSRLFTVQAETGAVYVRADVADLDLGQGGVSFIATVADLSGAPEALTDTITVQVKPLDNDELVLMATVEGALLEDADAVVSNLSDATELMVHLFRAYPAVSQSSRAGPTSARVRASRANTEAALTLLMYALDKNEALVTVEQFQKLLASSEFDLPWTVTKVENLPPEAEDVDPTEVTGYMVAIIVLAVLIIVAVVGAAAGYYFYFRPRMGPLKQKDGYTEFTSDADKPSPLESQIPQITTTVEPNISTVSEIIEPVIELTVNNDIQTSENSVGVLAPGTEDDWPRKRSVTIRGGPDDYNDIEAPGETRRSESSDSIDGDESKAESERRKSTVHFNENVECIEVDRL